MTFSAISEQVLSRYPKLLTEANQRMVEPWFSVDEHTHERYKFRAQLSADILGSFRGRRYGGFGTRGYHFAISEENWRQLEEGAVVNPRATVHNFNEKLRRSVFYFIKELIDKAQDFPNFDKRDLLKLIVDEQPFGAEIPTIKFRDEELPVSIYSASKASRAMYATAFYRTHAAMPMKTVLELGGGFGRSLRDCLSINPIETAYYVDLPFNLTLAATYLEACFPGRVNLVWDAQDEIILGKINVLVPWYIDKIEKPIDLMMNFSSFHHMPQVTMNHYFDTLISPKVKYLYHENRMQPRSQSEGEGSLANVAARQQFIIHTGPEKKKKVKYNSGKISGAAPMVISEFLVNKDHQNSLLEEFLKKLREFQAHHDDDKALKLIDRLQEQTPEGLDPPFVLAKAAFLADSGRFDQCIEYIRNLEVQSPELYMDIKSQEIYLLNVLERWDEVEAALDRLIGSKSQSKKLPVTVVAVLVALGAWDKLSQLIFEGPDGPLGGAFNLAKKWHRSGLELSKSKSLVSSDLDAWKTLFKRVGNIDGFRHNYRFHDGSKLLDFAKVKANSPVTDQDFNFFEWELIRRFVPDFSDKRVLDIGAFDGFFSIQSALQGAKSVDALEREPIYLQRAMSFAKLFGVADRINPKFLNFDRAFVQRAGRYDIIFALGLIYHLDNLYYALANLCTLSDRIVIETTTAEVQWDNDDNAISYKENDPVDVNWVKAFFRKRGYSITESPEWAEYVDRYDVSRGRRLLYFFKI